MDKRTGKDEYPDLDELDRQIRRLVEPYPTLIVLNIHKCTARTFTEAVTAFPARYLLGLSATP